MMIVEMMHAIGIIPENAEIGGGGLQPGEAAHRFIIVGNALGIGIFGHAPDALDGIILADQLFNQIHIRSVFFHRNADHLNAEMLANGEMTVVAGDRAEKLHFFQAAPGLWRTINAM